MYGINKAKKQGSIGNGYIINCHERPITKVGRRGKESRDAKEEKEMPML